MGYLQDETTPNDNIVANSNDGFQRQEQQQEPQQERQQEQGQGQDQRTRENEEWGRDSAPSTLPRIAPAECPTESGGCPTPGDEESLGGAPPRQLRHALW